jgi:hypothetical protein
MRARARGGAGRRCRCLVQQYIANPFLVDGYKCDMRFYVLGTSFDPLRLYIFGAPRRRLRAGAPHAVSPNAFSPNAFSPNAFSPNAWATEVAGSPWRGGRAGVRGAKAAGHHPAAVCSGEGQPYPAMPYPDVTGVRHCS